MILSAQFRELVDRVNGVYTEAEVRPDRQPDYLTMMSNLWSPEGWQRALPKPPWREAYETCLHIGDVKEYTNACKAADGGKALRCQYKACLDRIAKPGDTHKSAPAQVRQPGDPNAPGPASKAKATATAQ